jgi:hypothetical protein
MPEPTTSRVVSLKALGRLLVVDASARRSVDLGELVVFLGAVKALFEDGLGLVHIELGLEAVDVRGDGAAVGAAPSVGEIEVAIVDLVAWRAPIASAAAVLLGLLGINASKAILAEELGNVVFSKGRAGGDGSMGAVVELVGAGHFDGWRLSRMLRDGIRRPVRCGDEMEWWRREDGWLQEMPKTKQVTMGAIRLAGKRRAGE